MTVGMSDVLLQGRERETPQNSTRQWPGWSRPAHVYSLMRSKPKNASRLAHQSWASAKEVRSTCCWSAQHVEGDGLDGFGKVGVTVPVSRPARTPSSRRPRERGG